MPRSVPTRPNYLPKLFPYGSVLPDPFCSDKPACTEPYAFMSFPLPTFPFRRPTGVEIAYK